MLLHCNAGYFKGTDFVQAILFRIEWCGLLLTVINSFAIAETVSESDPVQQSLAQQQISAPFSLLMYQPNYVLPVTLNSQPSRLSSSQVSDGQSLQPISIRFQFSVKVPLWTSDPMLKNRIFFGYTQLSFWQAYNKSPFFQATDYQPEIFLTHLFDKKLAYGWRSQWLQFGLKHQSNGEGGVNERTWNRLYAAVTLSHQAWLLTIEPWHVLTSAAYQQHNPDMAHYLGYGQGVVAYKFNNQSVTLTSYGFDPGALRATAMLTWSIPLTQHVNGYSQLFSGYGQNLFQYNHHVNSVGIGFSLNEGL